MNVPPDEISKKTAKKQSLTGHAEQAKQVELFWHSKPCDSDLSDSAPGSREYFAEIERDRYRLQYHIPEVLAKIQWRDKQVLEIGAGVGTEGRQMVSRGARYCGINLDQGSTDITAQALAAFSLPGTALKMSATELQFGDASFDVVFSFGVLHHIPDVDRAIPEIFRVLKPGGELLIMVYNRSSINYRVEIRILRKLFLRLLVLPGMTGLFAALGFPREKLARHRVLYLTSKSMSEQEWLSRNTDGPDNPYSQVYDKHEAERLLGKFEVLSNEVYFFDYRHWGLLGRAMPKFVTHALGRRWGWHRVVHARKPISTH
jgi:SAM-dependent methyltransferase